MKDNNVNFQHKSVLLDEVIKSLVIKDNGIYVDCTIGGAGHSLAILKNNPRIKLIGIDQDPQALETAELRLQNYASQVELVLDNYRNLKKIFSRININKVDGILMDIGVSSPQLDQKERGFSYQHDAPLDMRMSPDNSVTAEAIINTYPVEEITEIIKNYSEERWAKRIAEFIGQERKKNRILTTHQLVDIIKQAIPKGARRTGPHPAKRTFQALRIAVNQELDVLREALYQAVDLLKVGGRICVISFHSLEDRIVKDIFKELATDCICPSELPICVCNHQAKIKLITRKPITPGEKELSENSRARSAKLRVGERLSSKEE